MFKTILMAVDLGEESSWQKALPAALLHARSEGGSLTLVTVVPDFGESIVETYFPADFAEKATANAEAELEAFRAAHVPSDVPSKAMVRTGGIYHEIIAAAGEIGADLIVMASHRPALSDYLLGPNADRVVRHAKCSVLVVRN
jgi:nucleotide-binding universal stress UspA family protein